MSLYHADRNKPFGYSARFKNYYGIWYLKPYANNKSRATFVSRRARVNFIIRLRKAGGKVLALFDNE